MPAMNQQLTPKQNVDDAMDELLLLRLDPGEKLELNEQDSKNLNSTLTTPRTTIEKPTKA